MSYKNYKGKEKYHFRYYKKTRNHPFLVIMVTDEIELNGKIYLYGFNLTHSTNLYQKRNKEYIKLHKNPNPKDKANSYLNKRLIRDESALFSSPIKGWHLSEQDEEKMTNY